ncbi:hypothetical protein AB0I61_32820 [Polymorphospora rubra]|uniref:hypothetical protein n=1 Tax=Polymorphospora rubra TaxID=338584 RepID=UPI0033E2673A
MVDLFAESSPGIAIIARRSTPDHPIAIDLVEITLLMAGRLRTQQRQPVGERRLITIT